MRTVQVELDFDEEANVWWVSACDVQGVRIEAASFDVMMARLPGAVEDMLDNENEARGSFRLKISLSPDIEPSRRAEALGQRAASFRARYGREEGPSVVDEIREARDKRSRAER